ncbi:hypothetical protein TgHK011_000486 [Trichoderma gracile]|nr:hypothetical protein TgHK011_000486 [Trichoderma gracile]
MKPEFHQFHGPCDAIAASKDHRRLSLRCCTPSRPARIPLISKSLRRKLLAWGIANNGAHLDDAAWPEGTRGRRNEVLHSKRRPLCFETCLDCAPSADASIRPSRSSSPACVSLACGMFRSCLNCVWSGEAGCWMLEAGARQPVKWQRLVTRPRSPSAPQQVRKSETLRLFAMSSETRQDRPASASRLAARRNVPPAPASCATGNGSSQPAATRSPEYRHLRDDRQLDATCSQDGSCAHAGAPPNPRAWR